MSNGRLFRQGFEMLLQALGGTVLIHRNWGTSEIETREVRGLKNNEEGKPDKVMFQFGEQLDIRHGDILQVKSARDLWRVIEIEDEVQADVYVNLTARVVKASEAQTQPQPALSTVVIQGSVYGGVQVGTTNSIQTVNVEHVAVVDAVSKLKGLIAPSSIPELDREEAMAALDRIESLSKKEKTPDVVSLAKDKLSVVKSAVSIAKDLALVAAPYLNELGKFFT